MTAPPPSLPPIRPTIAHWRDVQTTGRPVCSTTRRFDRYDGKNAWDVVGELAARFESIVQMLYDFTMNPENRGIFKPPVLRRIRRPTREKFIPTYNLFFLSSTFDWKDSELTLVAQCADILFAQNAIKKFRGHPPIKAVQEELGFVYLAWEMPVDLYAGERKISSGNAGAAWSRSQFKSLCGSHIVIAQRPTGENSRFIAATVGAVFMFKTKYYGLTAAHAFDAHIEDDLDDSSESGDNEQSDIPGHSALEEHAQEEQPNASWLEENDVYLEHNTFSGKVLSHIGYIELNEEDESRQFSLELDWALFEITDSRFFLPNLVQLLNTEVYSLDFGRICKNPPSPDEHVSVLCGSGIQNDVTCTGSVTGITFPWSTHVQQVWEVQTACGHGDCGSWVVNAQGWLVGMVVAGRAGLPCTYIIPAKNIVHAIQTRWSAQVSHVENMNPVVSRKVIVPNTNTLEKQPEAKSTIQESQKSMAAFLLDSWLRSHQSLSAGYADRDSAIDSEMADLSVQDTVLRNSLRNMSPDLRVYARISEQDIAGSFIFLHEHSKESGLAAIEMLLEAAAENCKQENMHAALSMVHQAALMRKYSRSDKTSFEAFRSALIQEDFDLTSSWASEVSRYFQALVKEVPRHRVTSTYAEVVFEADELGPPTNMAIESTNLNSAYSDIRYYVRKRPEQFFKPGRVFAMLWTSESIQTALSDPSQMPISVPTKARVSTGSQTYVRRMVVFEQEATSVRCFPISTYGGRGVSRPGFSLLDQRNHAIIYVSGTQSVQTEGENLDLTPIAVSKYKDRVLDAMSRINYGIVQSISLGVIAMNIGKVHDSSWADFKSNWQTVQSRKQGTPPSSPRLAGI